MTKQIDWAGGSIPEDWYNLRSLPNMVIDLGIDYLITNDKYDCLDLNLVQPGEWILETTSLKERRYKYGAGESLGRFICFYKETPCHEPIVLMESLLGKLIKWENAKFYIFPRLKHTIQRQDENGLEWALKAIKRHQLKEHLSELELLSFDKKFKNILLDDELIKKIQKRMIDNKEVAS